MKRFWPVLIVLVLVSAVGSLSLVYMPTVKASVQRIARMLSGNSNERAGSGEREEPTQPRAELVANLPNAIRIPAKVVDAFGVKTVATRPPSRPPSLVLTGSLALDTNRLAHVHSRFVGEVVEIGTTSDASGDGAAFTRPVRFGDRVEKDQVLAVLWSTELGEKKSEYVDALSRLKLEQETYARLEKLYKDEAIAERNLREARRNVEAAEIAVARVERTLKVWRMADDEIEAIHKEADLIRKRQITPDDPIAKSWARVELRAPLAGIVLEKNLAVGDIVDTATDLFKIGNLEQLRVWAYVYEEDLPTLLSLPQPIRWQVRLKADPASPLLSGAVEKIGVIIDPAEHTALVSGHVDNPDGHLRAGQFITATIDLPTDPSEVEVPVSAIIDDGQESIVFIQPDPKVPVYAEVPMRLQRRLGSSAVVRPQAESESSHVVLHRGERVVESGAIELRAALEQLKAAERDSR
jgi:cobalt-zinc-cadmium efflux system membrane fusion protein